MTDIARVHDFERMVALQRRKGDAAARSDHKDQANKAYERALSLTDRALALLPISRPVEHAQTRSLQPEVAIEAAELLGVRGGILRRLDRVDEALKSYREGAICEETHQLPRTYNRVNALKLTLITGDGTVAQLQPTLGAFSALLERRLSTDERASSPWNPCIRRGTAHDAAASAPLHHASSASASRRTDAAMA